MNPDDSDIKPDDVLLDGDELASALGTLSAEPDAFREGVQRRIDERSTDATAEAPRPMPKWLKRAAAIVPPGVMQAALATKTVAAKSGVAKGGLALTPWALVLLGLASVVGLFFATAGLQGDRAAGLEREHAVKALRRSLRARMAWMATLTIPFALFFAAMLLRNASLVVLGFACSAVICVLVVRALSRAGLADRRQVGSLAAVALSWSMAIAGPLTFGQVRYGFLTAFVTWPLLVLAMSLAMWISGEKKARVATWVMVPLITLLSLVLFLTTNTTLDGMTPRQIETWCQRFGDPVTQIGDWAEFGLAREALGAEAFDALDLTKAREALAGSEAAKQKGKRIHPVTTLGAWRARIASPEMIAAHGTYDFTRESARKGEMLFVIDEGDILSILAWKQAGLLDDALRAGIRQSIDKNLRSPTEINAVERARHLLDAADVAGDTGFVERNRERLHAILTKCWSRDGSWYQTPGGFGTWSETDGEVHISAENTLHAVRLMERVGVPEGIELHIVDEYLTTEVLRGSTTDPHPYFLQANYARMNLRRAFDVSPPGSAFVHFLWKNMVFVTVVLFAALCIWLVYRAPKPVSIDDGPLTENAPA